MESKRKYSTANYEKPSTSERLIGRNEQIKEIERKIIKIDDDRAKLSNRNNLALVGLPLIGKSSIILHTLLAQREELFAREKPMLVINIDLQTSGASYSDAFFFLLFTSCRDELRNRQHHFTKRMHTIAQDMRRTEDWSPVSFKYFFKEVHGQGISTVFILENFDFVDKLLKDDIASFDFLRELATRSDYGIKLVTLSQCLLTELEPPTQDRAISRFSQSFGIPCFVGMFNDAEMSIYFERLASFGLTITDTVKAYIEACCGRHPYLLEMFGDTIDGLHTLKPDAEPDIHEAGRKIESSIVIYIDGLIQQMRRRGMFNNLVQVVVGPISTVKDIEIKTFCDYGLIKPAPEPREADAPEYVAFCTRLQEVLPTSKLDAPTHTAALTSWVILRDQTENTLRNAAETLLRDFYGNDWITALEQKYPKFLNKDGRNLFHYCREKAANIHSSTAKPFKSLLEHTTMRELFDLVLREWSCFGTLFDESEWEWNRRFSCIGEVRNEEAHSKFQHVHPDKLAEAEKYCRAILARLHF